MLSCIKEKVGETPSSEITSLVLDGCQLSKIEGLEEFENLEVLTLVNNNISSLENLPKLSKLRKLELSDNNISGGLDNIQCENLEILKLSNNKISELSCLEPLKNLECLKTLDLLECPITEVEGYREKVFSMIPSLEVLDNFDADGDVISSEDENEDTPEEENGVSGDQDAEDDVGLEYLVGQDLPDDEEDGNYTANGGAVSEDDEEELPSDDDDEEDDDCELNELSREDPIDSNSRKRPAGVAFPEEKDEIPEKR